METFLYIRCRITNLSKQFQEEILNNNKKRKSRKISAVQRGKTTEKKTKTKKQKINKISLRQFKNQDNNLISSSYISNNYKKHQPNTTASVLKPTYKKSNTVRQVQSNNSLYHKTEKNTNRNHTASAKRTITVYKKRIVVHKDDNNNNNNNNNKISII